MALKLSRNDATNFMREGPRDMCQLSYSRLLPEVMR
jgi:hypothetical protein